MSQPKIGRIDVYVTCSCGTEVEFDDADLTGAYESQPCDDCGRVVEIHVDAGVAHPKRATPIDPPAIRVE